MSEMFQSEDSHMIPMTSISSGTGREVKPDIYYYTNQIVNVIFLGNPDSGSWYLFDTGMPNSGQELIEVAEKRFGKDAKPEAVFLTHGHFDHIGSIVNLLEKWPGVPVYAHHLEFPYLTGKLDYPEPDPTVEGGLLAKISKIYPHKAINIEPALHPLPADGQMPGLSDWKWIHTPGHAPGHVSYFRQSDRLLIAGDAFVTVQQDSFYKVLVQKEEVCGPPPYLTTDWAAAEESVRLLEVLRPSIAITGHGTHMEGIILQQGLAQLSERFEEAALPKYGKYVKREDDEKRGY